ncbi:hypothetical protein Y032_0131g1641 [Ancylostoma ceylanicum]|nr:hypothetical protein Y032_0131g1641 [Ancylostoma ceylanicum]
MQLTTFLPCLAALFTAVHGQYYPQQASQQYYPQQQYAPQPQYPGQWRQWDQPQSYQSQPQFLPQQPVQANYQQNFAFPPQQQQQRFPLPQYQQQVPPPPQQFVPTLQQFQQQVPQFAQQQYQQRPPPPPPVVFNQPPPPPPPQPVQQAVFKPRPVYREGPKIYEQQFKINKAVPVEGFMPQLVEPQLPIQQRIRVPPPPERFHPHLADIYGQPSLPDRPSSSTRPTIILIGESLPEGAYGAEERLIDGNHPSYIEDTAKTTPVDQFRKFVQPQVVIPKPAPRRPSVPRPQPPVRYRACPTAPYITVIFVLCSLFAIPTVVWGFVAQDDEVIPYCNPPLGLAPNVSHFWSVSNVVVNCIVLLVYATIIGFVHFRAKSRACHEQRKVVRRLQVIVIVFIFSWFMAILGVNVGILLGFPPDIFQLWQSNMGFFAMICYSQTFYVCIWRSKEYRSAFIEQLQLMVCRKPQVKIEVSTSRSQVTRVITVQAQTKTALRSTCT